MGAAATLCRDEDALHATAALLSGHLKGLGTRTFWLLRGRLGADVLGACSLSELSSAMDAMHN